MTDQSQNSPAPFDAIVVISPGHEGDDEKNQDCARYYPGDQVAVVADGASTSPHSGPAARIIGTAAPALFGGNPEDRMGGLSHVLMAQRRAAQHEPIPIPRGMAPAMIPAFRAAAMHQMAKAYQSTVVAMHLTSVSGKTQAKIIRCGDSELYAFRSDGTLITSTRRWEHGSKGQGEESRESPCFHPPFGTKTLVKVIGPLTRWPKLADRLDILPRCRQSWFVCAPVDVATAAENASPASSPIRTVRYPADDLWLVPGFILGGALAVGAANYRLISYSRNIRQISQRQPRSPANTDTSITEVLPDHFASGRWMYAEESFPPDTHFVLASDGFYRCFLDEPEMWEWLVQYQAMFKSSPETLNELHERMRIRFGDDDISFVWVRPTGWPIRSGCCTAASHNKGDGNHGQ